MRADPTDKTVHALIEQRASEVPDAVYAIGLVTGQVLRYGELAASCRRVGALLHSHGLRAGDTVSLVMPNGPQTLRVLLGAMHAGMVVNPVNLLSQAEQMRHVLGHSDCKLVCVAPEWEARVRTLLATLDRAIQVIVADPDGAALPGVSHEATLPAPPRPRPTRSRC